MNIENGKLKAIIQGGAVGISILLIILVYYIITSYNRIINNDLSHIGEYINKNTEVLKSIEKTVEANTLQNQRLETVINKLEFKIK